MRFSTNFIFSYFGNFLKPPHAPTGGAFADAGANEISGAGTQLQVPPFRSARIVSGVECVFERMIIECFKIFPSTNEKIKHVLKSKYKSVFFLHARILWVQFCRSLSIRTPLRSLNLTNAILRSKFGLIVETRDFAKGSLGTPSGRHGWVSEGNHMWSRNSRGQNGWWKRKSRCLYFSGFSFEMGQQPVHPTTYEGWLQSCHSLRCQAQQGHQLWRWTKRHECQSKPSCSQTGLPVAGHQPTGKHKWPGIWGQANVFLAQCGHFWKGYYRSSLGHPPFDSSAQAILKSRQRPSSTQEMSQGQRCKNQQVHSQQNT